MELVERLDGIRSITFNYQILTIVICLLVYYFMLIDCSPKQIFIDMFIQPSWNKREFQSIER